MNQWLKKKAFREAPIYSGVWHDKTVTFPIGTSLKSLKSRLTVSFWAIGGRGEREFFQSVYPFEEVITHRCSAETTINGFSIWLDGMTQVMWQSFNGTSGYTIPAGGCVEITTGSLFLA